MKVILKEDVENLGEIGSIVDVKKGFGRNYLLPRNLAVEANPKNLKQFEHEKKAIMAKARKVRESMQGVAEKVSALTLTIEAQAGEEGKLFGSVTSRDIAEAIAQQGIEVDKRKIVLEQPIKQLGSYDVAVKVHQDVTATVKVEVIKSGVEEPGAEVTEDVKEETAE